MFASAPGKVGREEQAGSVLRAKRRAATTLVAGQLSIKVVVLVVLLTSGSGLYLEQSCLYQTKQKRRLREGRKHVKTYDLERSLTFIINMFKLMQFVRHDHDCVCPEGGMVEIIARVWIPHETAHIKVCVLS